MVILEVTAVLIVLAGILSLVFYFLPKGSRSPLFHLDDEEHDTPVVDLDDLIEKPIHIRLHGKDHKLNPIKTAEFFEITNGLASLRELAGKKGLTGKELADCYFKLFKGVCSTITRKDIDNMTQAQCAAFLMTVTERISGKTAEGISGNSDEVKKKSSP